jgi:hypothetical protein
MNRYFLTFPVAALLLGSPVIGQAPTSAKPFGLAEVRFEQNATDQDAEVVFEATGDRDGLVQLAIVSPDGRNVVDFKAPEGSMGIRQFRMESPEPGDVAKLKAAYPEGVYRFEGTTSAGVKLQSEAKLSHQLPGTVSFVRPLAGAKGVSAEKMVIAWSPVKGVAAYVVTIEQEEENLSVTARVPGRATRFAAPAGFLRPGTEYKLAVGTVMASGNASFVETTIETAAAAKASR